MDEFLRRFLESYVPVVATYFNDLKLESSRSWHLRVFSSFDYLPKKAGPKFVFSHILLPHPPFVLDKDCAPSPEQETKTKTYGENYLSQVGCVNVKIEQLVEKILTKSQRPPVIIIQADEGPHPIKNPLRKEGYWKEANVASLKEKFPIINAMYLPGLKENPLYPSISSVNTFRVVFNSYFNTQLELLPDKYFIFPDPDHSYQFIDVTERLK